MIAVLANGWRYPLVGFDTTQPKGFDRPTAVNLAGRDKAALMERAEAQKTA